MLVPSMIGGVQVWQRPPMVEHACACGSTWNLSVSAPPPCIAATCCGSTMVPVGVEPQPAVPHDFGSLGSCTMCGCTPDLFD